VGANGTGKSMLLKILADIDGLDAGAIVTMKGASIATCRRKLSRFPAAPSSPSA